jgi:dsDNA-specific endonuclease/ATPase MutS2
MRLGIDDSGGHVAKKAASDDGGALGDIAQNLGTLLGNAEKQWRAWQGPRDAVVKAVTDVRDRAAALLAEMSAAAKDAAGKKKKKKKDKAAKAAQKDAEKAAKKADKKKDKKAGKKDRKAGKKATDAPADAGEP